MINCAAIYYTASVMAIMGGATEKQIRQLKDGLVVVMAQYGNHPFARRRSRVLDHLFTALRVPGMPLTNNAAEADIRKVVVYRNLHHQFKTARGMRTFSVLHSFVQTAEKNGHLPAEAIFAKMNDPDWSLFGDSGRQRGGSETRALPADTQAAGHTQAEGARIGTKSRVSRRPSQPNAILQPYAGM